MAKATTVMIPSLDEKPHMLRPLPLTKISSSLDEPSRSYVTKLLTHWLNDLDIPLRPWREVFLQVFLTMYEKASTVTTVEENRTIWIQTFVNNSPLESKFLPSVFHGKEISNGNNKDLYVIYSTNTYLLKRTLD